MTFLLNKLFAQNEIVSEGYKSVSIELKDTIDQPMIITMKSDNITTVSSPYIRDQYPENRFGFFECLLIDMLAGDFSEYESIIGSYNVDALNKSIGSYGCELAGTYKRFFAGINIGINFNNDTDHDSLEIECNTTQYGLHFGYHLVDSKRLFISPQVSFKWNKYRLQNFNKDKRIPLEQYIADRDLDMRFNQATGFLGLNTSYKIYYNDSWSCDYWTIGIYGGYMFKLNERPWTYSKGNRLTSDYEINMKHYNIGITLAFYWE